MIRQANRHDRLRQYWRDFRAHNLELVCRKDLYMLLRTLPSQRQGG
jgi:hypothetical protein